MNAHGRLACFNAGTGREVWNVEVLERFGARNVTWGRSESVIVHEKKVYVSPVGKKALMAAIDKETGKTLWASSPIPEEKAAYVSPILVELSGEAVLVGSGSRHSFGVDAETGELLWKQRHPVEENVLGSTPALAGNSVFITNSSREESALYSLKLLGGGSRVERAWSRDFKNGQAALVLVNGRLYGANGRSDSDGTAAVDPSTGSLDTVKGVSFGAAAYADGRIYYLTQLGEMVLLEPTSGGARVTGRFRLVEPRRKDAWAHPVIARGRLFLRYHDTLYCYDVRRP
jgi:outer membrane protein assembly factor BamB